MEEIKLGDKVRLINTGGIYTTYDDKFKELNFRNTKLNDFVWKNDINQKFTVFGITNHEFSAKILFAIEQKTGHGLKRKQLLIDRDCIELWK